MGLKKRALLAGILLLCAPALFWNCNLWSAASVHPVSALPTAISGLVTASMPTPTEMPVSAAMDNTPQPIATAAVVLPTPQQSVSSNTVAEPAGCLSAEAQAGLGDPRAMLAYADRLLGLSHPLSKRLLPSSWNSYTGADLRDERALSLNVGDVQNQYMLQRLLNALQVSGFVTWLRKTPGQDLHILAIPLAGPYSNISPWQPYIQAYWQDRQSRPAGDTTIIPVLKLPPCTWMVAQGFAPRVDPAAWWVTNPNPAPDYAAAAVSYVADTNEAAVKVARRIDWLGSAGQEGPNTMCGPLAWSIMHDAGALPPDFGGWSDGPRSFWLSKPAENGRPWSLFPAEVYQHTAFHQPLGSFDFEKFPLYPGDFFYTYSAGDGFDHMFVVTEVDAAGNVYTVTNLIHMVPVKKITIERVLLLNLHDPTVGIARNQWANDRVNGRTGHAGFEVFRWNWMEKNIKNQPVAYTVQPGDMLGLIAERWKTPAEQIARYNGIGVDTVLAIGQELGIPPNETVGR